MDNKIVKSTKELFLRTGRLNKKVINDAISKSWYKCYIGHLKSNERFKIKTLSDDSTSTLSEHFIKHIENIYDEAYSTFICDKNLNVVSKHIVDLNLDAINNVDELYIGTNAASIALKSEKICKVSLEEHYLDSLSQYYTFAVPIKLENDILGVMLIVSELDLTDFKLVDIEKKIKNYNRVKGSELTLLSHTSTKIKLNDVFTYPEAYFSYFKERVDKSRTIRLPLLIMGTEGSGKTALAMYLSNSNEGSRSLLDIAEIPEVLQYKELLDALYYNRTVIVENIDCLNSKSAALLTVYTEEKILGNSTLKFTDFKCSALVLTTINTQISTLENHIKLQRLVQRIKQNCIVLKNLSEFEQDRCKLVKTILDRNLLEYTADYLNHIVGSQIFESFKDIVQIVESTKSNNEGLEPFTAVHLKHLSHERYQSLEKIECEYIRKVVKSVDNNLSLAAEILEISRSTLYRKLEKYQIETN